MKKLMGIVLVILIGFIVSKWHNISNVAVTTSKKSLSRSDSEPPRESATVRNSNNVVKAENSIGLKSHEDLESELKSYSSLLLVKHLVQVEKKLESAQLIKRANSNLLTEKQRVYFREQIRTQIVIRKILIERKLDQIERERS